MRHGNKVNHLKRTTSHRAALLSNLASSLIIHKRINTTLAKAKELRRYVEPLITRSKPAATKVEDMNNRRLVFSKLENKQAVAELFKEVGPKVANRAGGYTRIIRYSISTSPKPNARRRDDAADMCFIELVDYNEAMLAIKAEGKKPKTTRRSRSKAKKADDSSSEESKSE